MIALYVAQIIGLVNFYVTVVIICFISFVQSMDYLLSLVYRISKALDYKNLTVKQLLYPTIIFVSFLLFCLYQVVDSWQQEGDYSTDGFLLVTLALMWFT